jgi:uncharacterized protein (UPF0332 family)
MGLCMMNEIELKNLLEDSFFLDAKIKFYSEKLLITRAVLTSEIKGHREKAKHNLHFVKDINSEFNDWKLVVCYYAAYHAALALIATKGFSTKNHDATLCLLIKYFYNEGLSKEDIELLNMFDTQDLLFYVESKQKREDAQYSTRINFEVKDAEKMKIKTRLFINKAEEIINSLT